MTKYNTGNAVGSADPRDLYDNAPVFDEIINNLEKPTVLDRLGRARITLANQLGYNLKGDYAAGIELNSYNDIIRYSGEFYGPAASTALPYTTTATLPDADSNLVGRGDAVLRQELALEPADGLGAALVNGATIFVGSVAGELNAQGVSNARYQVKEFWQNTDIGGGEFYWDSSLDKTNHNGITIIDPNKVASELSGAAGVFGSYFTPVATSGSLGCYVRVSDGPVNVQWAGARAAGTDATESAQACSDAGFKEILFPEAGSSYYLEGFLPADGVSVSGKGVIEIANGMTFKAEVAERPASAHSPQTIMFEDEEISWEQFAAMRSLGYNTLLHYAYSNQEQIIFSAEAAGMDLILRSATDSPTLPGLYDSRPSVVAWYLFDEPDLAGVSVANQETRISAHRAVTDKPLMITATQDNSINLRSISDKWDVILYDLYYRSTYSGYNGANASENAALYALNVITQLQTLCPKSKLIPCIGLFTGLSGGFSSSTSTVSKFAKDLARTSKTGDVATFIWSGSTDPSVIDFGVKDSADFQTSARLSVSWATTYEKIKVDSLVAAPLTSPANGLAGFIKKAAWNITSDIFPFRTVNVGSVVNDRDTTFSEAGVAIKNAGGAFNLAIPSESMAGLCYIYGSVKNNYISGADITVKPVYTEGDGYVYSDFSAGVTVPAATATQTVRIPFRGDSVGGTGYTFAFSMTASPSNGTPWRFWNGVIIYSTWPNSTY